MRRDLNKVKDFMSSFNQTRELVSDSDLREEVKKKVDVNKEKVLNRGYESVRNALKKRSKSSGKCNSTSLLSYFKFKADSAGYKYLISNYAVATKPFKDCLAKGLTYDEVKLMIDFVYDSEQDYVDKKQVTPRLFISNFVNSLYPDSQEWSKGEYVSRKKKNISKRGWTGSTENKVTIGEWDF